MSQIRGICTQSIYRQYAVFSDTRSTECISGIERIVIAVKMPKIIYLCFYNCANIKT